MSTLSLPLQSQYGKYGNKEIYMNNSSNNFTGRTSGTLGKDGSTPSGTYEYNNLESAGDGMGQRGPGASTTGNIYGVYDMSGGAWEFVVGNYNNIVGKSGFKADWNTDYKDYIDFYTSEMISRACSGTVCKGHALSETAGWYGDSSYMLDSSYPWLLL